MTRDEIEAYDCQRHGRVYKCKIEIWRRWHEWQSQRRERAEYGWAYECGCDAPRGACSDPYCKEHRMRLMRYKKRLEK